MKADYGADVFDVFGADGLEFQSLSGDRYLLIAERLLEDDICLPLNISINRVEPDGCLVEERRIFLSREIYASLGEHGIGATWEIRSRLAEAIQLLASPSTYLDAITILDRLADHGQLVREQEPPAELSVAVADGVGIRVIFLPEQSVHDIPFFTERRSLFDVPSSEEEEEEDATF